MRLISATVRNYRLHRDLSVRFDAKRTIISGPNESGKSTLVEAIHRALFCKYKSSTGLDGIRPRFQTGHPEVILEFEADGVHYTLRKLFRGSSASIATLNADALGLRLDGDAAEERLRQILSVEDVGSGQFREQWAHLWVWQGRAGDDPTSQSTVGKAAAELQRRLGAMTGQNVLQTDRDERVLCLVVGEHAETFTNTGRVKAGSGLAVAQTALATARQDAAQAAAQMQAMSDAATSILNEERAIAMARATQRKATTSLAAAEETLTRIDRLETDLVAQRTAAATAATDYTTLDEANTRIEAILAELATLRAAIEPAEAHLAATVAEEAMLQGKVPASNESVGAALAAQRRITEESELGERLSRAFTLRAERTALETKATRIAQLKDKVSQLDEKLRRLSPVDEASVERLDATDRLLHVTQNSMIAIATRLELIRAGGTVSIDGRPMAAGTPETLTEPAEVTIDSTVIRVTPGGGQSLAESRLEISRLETELAAMLARLGVEDVTAARRSLGQRTEAQAARRSHVEEIDAIGESTVTSRLEAIGKEMADVDAEIERRMPPDRTRPDSEATLLADRRALEERRQKAASAVEDAQSADGALRRSLEETTTRRRGLEDALAKQRGSIEGLEGRRHELEHNHGVDRAGELERLALLKQQKAAAVKESELALAALQPDVVRADRVRFTRSLEVSGREITESERRRAEARGRLQQAGTVDLHEAKAAADSRLALAEARHAEIAGRAAALQLLRELFEQRRRTIAEQYAEPLRKKLAEYLDALYGPGNVVTVRIEGGALEELKVARPSAGGTSFDFVELSGGTREQVATACRLAMAEILASGSDTPGADHCLPIVLDDALANSDRDRIVAMQRVLDLGATRGLQIIVLSCDTEHYGLFGAEKIHLERPVVAVGGMSAAFPGAREADDIEIDASTDRDETPGSQEASPGTVPQGSDEELCASFLRVLEAFPGQKAGNKSLRDKLAWDAATYERVKDRLASERRIERGQGRGGSVRIPGGPGG